MASGDERRGTVQLIRYWESLRGNRHFPSEDDIDFDVLAPLWDDCFLVHMQDIATAGGRYAYTYVGKSIITAYGVDMTGEEVPFITPQADKLRHHLPLVLQARGPIENASEFINGEGVCIKYRQCMVPFARDDEHIDAVLGLMRMKRFPTEDL